MLLISNTNQRVVLQRLSFRENVFREVPRTTSLQYECTFHCYLLVKGSQAISACNVFSWEKEIARLVIALGQARMVSLAQKKILLVNHEGNMTDRIEGREGETERKEGGRF